MMVVTVIVVVAVVLAYLACDSADACTRSSADQRALQAFAEDGSQGRASGTADQGTLAGSDSAAVPVVVMVVIVAGVIVIPPAPAIADTVVELSVIAVVIALCAQGKRAK